MRYFWMTAFALGAGLLALPANAQNGNAANPATPSQTAPQLPGQSPTQEQTTPPGHDQSAQAPAVIPPPATGDSNVIAPPATGVAKGPVIAPPGSPGGNQTVQPK